MKWLFGGALSLLALGGLAFFAWRSLHVAYELSLARQALLRGSNAQAVEALQALQGERPRDAELSFLLAAAKRRAGEIAEARECLARAAELGWPRKQVMLQQAMCDFQSGNRDAEPFLLESLKEGCDDETANEVYECLVKGYLVDLYLREASLCIDFWIQWQPNAPQPHAFKAEISNVVGDTAREVEEYRTLLRIDPNNREARMKLGHALLESRAAAQALEEFQRCRQLAPNDPGVNFAIAACQRSLGDLDEAERGLRASLEADLSEAHRAFAYTELGQLLVAKRSYEEAVGCFEKALQLSPDDRTAHYALGLALSRVGRTDEGEKHLDKSRIIDEQNSRLSDLVHEIIRLPDDPSPRCTAGEILLEQGNRRDAYSWLVSALRCDKTHRRTHAALAKYYTLVGQLEAAERHTAWAENGGQLAAADKATAP